MTMLGISKARVRAALIVAGVVRSSRRVTARGERIISVSGVWAARS
jgi:hypothetical protein